MSKQKGRQSGVKHHGRAAEERCTNQRNKANRNSPLGGPVGRTVALLWFRMLVSVVDGSNNVAGRLGDGFDVADGLHKGGSSDQLLGLEANTGQHG